MNSLVRSKDLEAAMLLRPNRRATAKALELVL
jgi:hypothetical protein